MSRSGTVPVETTTEDPAPARRLVEILMAGLEELDAAGKTEAACRLAGQACVALRQSDQRAARAFDVFLHRATRKLAW